MLYQKENFIVKKSQIQKKQKLYLKFLTPIIPSINPLLTTIYLLLTLILLTTNDTTSHHTLPIGQKSSQTLRTIGLASLKLDGKKLKEVQLVTAKLELEPISNQDITIVKKRKKLYKIKNKYGKNIRPLTFTSNPQTHRRIRNLK